MKWIALIVLMLVLTVAGLALYSWSAHRHEAEAYASKMKAGIEQMTSLRNLLVRDGELNRPPATAGEFYDLAARVLGESMKTITNEFLFLPEASAKDGSEPLLLRRLLSDSFPVGFALETDTSIKTLDERNGSFSRYLDRHDLDIATRDWLLRK